jgi:hypothetical protein
VCDGRIARGPSSAPLQTRASYGSGTRLSAESGCTAMLEVGLHEQSSTGKGSVMGRSAAIALGAVVGLALGILVSVTTEVPLAPEVGLVLGGLVGWLWRRGSLLAHPRGGSAACPRSGRRASVHSCRRPSPHPLVGELSHQRDGAGPQGTQPGPAIRKRGSPDVPPKAQPECPRRTIPGVIALVLRGKQASRSSTTKAPAWETSGERTVRPPRPASAPKRLKHRALETLGVRPQRA